MQRQQILVVVGVILAVIIVVVATLALIPQKTPAFDAGVDFMTAVQNGDEETAFALLNDQMQTYVTENCPDGSASACIEGYTPSEWGHLLSAVFRRSRPDGAAWDIQLIATYEKGEGSSGVCIYERMEQSPDGAWQVAGWSGFISCDAPDARLAALADDPDAPNRAP
jgi:hypothetical protein